MKYEDCGRHVIQIVGGALGAEAILDDYMSISGIEKRKEDRAKFSALLSSSIILREVLTVGYLRLWVLTGCRPHTSSIAVKNQQKQ